MLEKLGAPLKPGVSGAATPGIRNRRKPPARAKPPPTNAGPAPANTQPPARPPPEAPEFGHQFWNNAHAKARPNLIYKANHSKSPPPPSRKQTYSQAVRQNPPPQYPPPLMGAPVQPRRPAASQPAYPSPTDNQRPTCILCLSSHHGAAQCWAKSSQCFRCGHIGHIARACYTAHTQ